MAEARRSRVDREPPVDDLAAPLAAEARGRIVALDFIRGFAVLGILAANIEGYALSNVEQGWPAAFHPLDGGSTATWLVTFLLVDGKMRSLFALLFGAGLALFIERADDRGALGMALQLRRLIWLALFGLLHFFLLFRGDILFTYALWGFVAAWMIRVRPGLLIALAGALYLCTVPADAIIYGPLLEPAATGAELPPSVDPQIWREDGARDVQAMQGGSLGEVVAYKAERHFLPQLSQALDALTDSFAMMLLGIALFRLGLFERGVGSKRLRRWGWGLASIGMALGLWLALPQIASGYALPQMRFYGHALMPLQRLPMTLGWLFLLLGYLPAMASTAIGQRITAAGRMAFSNYIGTSLAMALVFQGWGLGLFEHFDRLELAGFILAGWLAMLAWSKPWLARFRYGPLEWVWRCLTYWHRFPLRK